MAVVQPTKICSRCKQSKPHSDFYTAKDTKDGRQRWCKQCAKEVVKQKYWADPEKRRLYSKQYRKENRSKYLTYNRGYYVKNIDYFRQKKREYQITKPELTRKHRRTHYLNRSEYIKQRVAKYKKQNPHLVIALCAKRRTDELRATPKWADLNKIAEFYRQAKVLSDSTGILHHVDHIVPLRSKWVCGLHVENNLQVIPAVENMRKHNKWPISSQALIDSSESTGSYPATTTT